MPVELAKLGEDLVAKDVSHRQHGFRPRRLRSDDEEKVGSSGIPVYSGASCSADIASPLTRFFRIPGSDPLTSSGGRAGLRCTWLYLANPLILKVFVGYERQFLFSSSQFSLQATIYSSRSKKGIDSDNS